MAASGDERELPGPRRAEADHRDEGVRAALRDGEALGEAEVRGGGGGEAADDGAHGEDLGGPLLGERGEVERAQ